MTNWVKLGYPASAGIDPRATGRQLAEMAVKTINGTSPGVLPINNPSKDSIALNLGRARFLGLTIPESPVGRLPYKIMLTYV